MDDIRPEAAPVDRAFGAENRDRLLDRYFRESAAELVSPETAWRHVYRLLLWIDRTIGLAHCYESDKCQPGRPWYARALAFHRWVSGELGCAPTDLAGEIDWLFATAAHDLNQNAEQRRRLQLVKAEAQMAAYESETLPTPGRDSALELLLSDALIRLGVDALSDRVVSELGRELQVYFGLDNKRKNLVGEGFEDTVAAILRRLPGVSRNHSVLVRPALHDIPGFNAPRGGDKTKRVDLALVRHVDGRRTLVSCKWSIRSDREEQFASDFEAYARLEASGGQFDYVLVTNEFDPARLAAACDSRAVNAPLFSSVVHVNPLGTLAAYAAPGMPSRAIGGIARAEARIASGRLSSLENWLAAL
jgi:hypothetical protein